MVDGSMKSTSASGPLEQVFAEVDFLPMLGERIRPLLEVHVYSSSVGATTPIPAHVLSTLEDRARQLETFLDDYDARSNRTFAPITEVVASLRGFAVAAYTLHHLMSRVGSYGLRDTSGFVSEFHEASIDAVEFVDTALRSLLQGASAEARRILGKFYPEDVTSLAEPPRKPARFRLPRNLDLASTLSEREKVAELATQYLGHLRTLDGLSKCAEFLETDDMRRYVLEVSDEEQCRYFEARIHNLQSMYDTFVKSTAVEADDPELKVFRGHVSLTLHLIECMTALVHFYERHENDIRNEETKNLVASLVEKSALLRVILNFCLFHAHRGLREGRVVADGMIARYTSQLRVTVVIPDGVTLHARPVALIAKVVAHHATPVNLEIGQAKAYAGSMLKMLMAVGANPGIRQVTLSGDSAPVNDLIALFRARLGEDGPGSLPDTLSYLGV